MTKEYYLGIEATNRTVALLANSEGEVVGRGTAGPSIYSQVGLERCGQTLWTAIIGAFSGAGYNTRDLLATEGALPEVEAICIGMTGIERRKDEASVQRILAGFNLADSTLITGEAHIVLNAGIEAGYGVSVLAGDSGLAFGVNKKGTKARAGGWGIILGEEGSAYWTGLEAIKAILAAADQRSSETSLTGLVEQQWKIAPNRPDSLAQQVYSLLEGLGSGGNKAQVEDTLDRYKRKIATLAPLVERAAQKGDQIASSILDRGADALSSNVTAVINRTGLNQSDTLDQLVLKTLKSTGSNKVPLALSGSLFLSNQGELRRRLLERLENTCAEPALVTEPALGALRLAIKL